MNKLWQKNNKVSALVEKFTIGNDQAMDQYLAAYDVLGSIAHTTMLSEVGLLTAIEQTKLKKALVDIYQKIQAGAFTLDSGVEDIHSQVEMMLTESLGDIGKKIHSARSRKEGHGKTSRTDCRTTKGKDAKRLCTGRQWDVC